MCIRDSYSTGTCKIKAQFYNKNIFLPPLPFFVFFRYFLTFMDKPGRPAPQFELSKKLFPLRHLGKSRCSISSGSGRTSPLKSFPAKIWIYVFEFVFALFFSFAQLLKWEIFLDTQKGALFIGRPGKLLLFYRPG